MFYFYLVDRFQRKNCLCACVSSLSCMYVSYYHATSVLKLRIPYSVSFSSLSGMYVSYYHATSVLSSLESLTL